MSTELSTLGSVIKTAYEGEADTNAFTDAEKTKLTGIETAADVTDTANVTAAGALMDSEVTNLAAVKAFDPTDYATSAQGATADTALQNVSEDTTPTLGGDLDANGQNVTNLGDVTFQTGAAGGTLRTGTSNADKFQLQAYDVNDATYRTLIEADAGNDVRLQIPADYLDLEDATDPTKIARFDISGVATGTTRTITMPDANVDLGAIATNTAKVTNATHSGDAVGDGALTLQPAAITGKGAVTVAGADHVLVVDDSASPQTLGKTTAQAVADLAKPTESIIVACSDETTALTTGTAKVTFRMPYAFTLSEVRATVTTAPVGSSIIVDINEKVGIPSPDVPTSILSTRLYIDAGEFSSEDASVSPAHQSVISDTSLADDSEITIDIDQIGASTAGAGLKVELIGKRT